MRQGGRGGRLGYICTDLIDEPPPGARRIDYDDRGREFDTDDGYSRGGDPFRYIDRVEAPAWEKADQHSLEFDVHPAGVSTADCARG